MVVVLDNNDDDIDRVLCQLLLDGKEGLHSFSLIVRMIMNNDDGQVLQLVNGITLDLSSWLCLKKSFRMSLPIPFSCQALGKIFLEQIIVLTGWHPQGQ